MKDYKVWKKEKNRRVRTLMAEFDRDYGRAVESESYELIGVLLDTLADARRHYLQQIRPRLEVLWTQTHPSDEKPKTKDEYDAERKKLMRAVKTYKPGDAFTASDMAKAAGIGTPSVSVYLTRNKRALGIRYDPRRKRYVRLESTEVKTETGANREKIRTEVENYPVGSVFRAKDIAGKVNLTARHVGVVLTHYAGQWNLQKENNTYRRAESASISETPPSAE